jgi:hypothetical protein
MYYFLLFPRINTTTLLNLTLFPPPRSSEKLRRPLIWLVEGIKLIQFVTNVKSNKSSLAEES